MPPPNKTLSHLSCHPSVTVLQERFLAKNRSRYTGVSQLHSHQSRHTVPLSSCREKMSTNFSCSQTFRGPPRDVLAKTQGCPTRKFVFPRFRGTCRTFWPPTVAHGHPFMWKTCTPPEDIRTQKFECVPPFSLPDLKGLCRGLLEGFAGVPHKVFPRYGLMLMTWQTGGVNRTLSRVNGAPSLCAPLRSLQTCSTRFTPVTER